MLASCIDRAAIVQGTRTPPSHGGNPGSNPGSGTPKVPASGQVFSLSRPLTASPLGGWSAARWGAEHRVTGRRRPAHPISACRSGVWPGEGSSEACARPGCRRRSKRALCWPADGDLKAAPIRGGCREKVPSGGFKPRSCVKRGDQLAAREIRGGSVTAGARSSSGGRRDPQGVAAGVFATAITTRFAPVVRGSPEARTVGSAGG